MKVFTYCLRALHSLLPAQQPTQPKKAEKLLEVVFLLSPGRAALVPSNTWYCWGERGDQQVAEKRACVCGSTAVSGKDSSKCQFALLNSYLQQYRIKEM